MPRVSVVIPAYNRAHLLGATLDSVLAQTYRDFEIIVVDDGSTDHTPALLAAYGDSIRSVRQANAGQAAARNAGIRLAQGDYIAFLDSDDLWLPRKLEKQMSRFLDRPAAAWIYSDAEVFDGVTGQTLHHFSQINLPHNGWVAPQLFLCDFIASPTPVVRRDVFEQVGYFYDSRAARIGEDWEMWLRIAACYSIEYIPEVLACYRLHAGGITLTKDIWSVHHSRAAVIDRAAAFAPEVYGPLRSKAMAALCLFTGRQFALAGQAKEAQSMFAQAIRLEPGAVQVYLHWLVCWLGRPGLSAIARLLLWLRGRWHAVSIKEPKH